MAVQWEVRDKLFDGPVCSTVHSPKCMLLLNVPDPLLGMLKPVVSLDILRHRVLIMRADQTAPYLDAL